MLEYEGADRGGAEESAAAAQRVHDKLHAQLDPLVGPAGVQALLARSAKLLQDKFVCLADVATIESSTKLRECLRVHEPAVITESAAALFGTFFALITTLIGERLTIEALRSAWPAIEKAAAGEREP